ncbi:MAG TPA: ABC transporter ATP-binding protein [Chitinispirillaceae bacterium]|nr:ABC transporter ATP-binding protein [Chitinispirillaceae bacterium]
MAAITVSKLQKNYGSVNALNGISFSVQKGSLFGIIGADGAGKSSLMRILVTLTNSDSGQVSVLEKNVDSDYQFIRSQIGYMPQRFSLYQDLSVKENLLFFADIYGVKSRQRKERFEKLLSFSRLEQFQNRRAAHLSGGMKQKLALCCALIHTPDILILDEPTTGVDPVSRNEFWDILKDLRKQGITIVVSTPYMDEASMCEQLLILHKGEILKNGTPEELLHSYPYLIYRVGKDSGSLIFKTPSILPDGIKLLYPSSGMMHVVLQNRDISKESVFSTVKSIFPEINFIESITPGIEDLFILLISERQ